MSTSERRRQAPETPRSSVAGAQLLGRAGELELIDSLLAAPGQGGSGLLMYGEPGVGKTALLDAAAARATVLGMRVLRACGVQAEARIAFSALHQLLYPVRHDVDRLTEHHRDALHELFGLSRTPAPEQVVSTAVLALLELTTAERGLLLLADDVAWFDEVSAAVLGFVVRRIADAPIVFLAASRTGTEDLFRRSGLPERRVGSLGTEESGAVLDAHAPGLAPAVRRRLLAEADGNPLALQELPAALTARQRGGQDPLPDRLPLSRRLEATCAGLFAELPAPTRRLLLLAALDSGAGLTVLRTAAEGSADIDDLVPAERAGLVRAPAAGCGLTFCHPLIATAVVNLAPPCERRAAHEALAAALDDDPERHAWHLAEAATGPDEAVARALDEAALAAWRRGTTPGDRSAPVGALVSDRRRVAASAAVTALMRAGELSPHPVDRSRRLVEAAFLATMTGQLDQVNRLLANAGQTPDTPTGLVFAATAHLLTHDEGDVDAAYRLLARALDDVTGGARTDNWDHLGILYTLLLVSLFTLRPEPWKLLDTAMARFPPEAVSTFRLCYDAYVDPTRKSDAIREGLADAFAALPTDAAPWQIVPLGFAAVALDALSDYRHLLHRMIERERDGGAIGMVIPALMLLCQDSYVHGQWDEAERLAQEGLDLAVVYGYQFWEHQVRAVLASGAALRGNAALARTRSEETTTWAAPRGMDVTEGYARSARNLAALGQGDFEEALVQAARIGPPGVPTPGVPGRWMVLDYVEAAVRTGRIEDAQAHVRAAQEAGIPRIGPRIELITAGAAAVAAGDGDAAKLFEAALALPDAARWPWDYARIQFAYGQWLRRTHDMAGARVQLSAALETFDRIGAAMMAQRATAELRATGVSVARPDAVPEPLTAQERQIAELAATGLSNKQIGERLFLSHRTVGSHLYRLYPKLGITSRAALRGALEALAAAEEDDHTL
ncbi:helix-turn-helix transcriptional regulator [Streptomyces chiangmaiensis]|uniref:AAA family ATPase n=1 Tax=Streptomyces chiangmaiensis TaxID=766497 RepID=A0ABU7FLY7_9ACTN|nr:AAA family ATPase [Streptomyces chiangmaiensis]MED7824950.1 AAA family ATPase [Streptomyces chiangmaiensis]